MSSKRKGLLLTAGLIFTANLALAGGYEDAQQAYANADYSKAFPLMEAQAKKDDAQAQFMTAVMYSRGQGVAQDSQAAVIWWSKAAAKGNMDAQEALAESYATGVGVKQDWSKAAQWAEKAAAKDSPNAQHLLGSLYEAGRGVKANPGEAYKWYYLASTHEGGFTPAADGMARLEKTLSPAAVTAAKAKGDKWIASHRKANKAEAKAKAK